MEEEEELILHVKGTEQDTTTLPKKVVRAAIAEGQISRSQLIWSPVDEAWKQVRELPHLLPTRQLAPAPAPRVQTGPMPRVVANPSAGTPVATPSVRVATPMKVGSTAHLVVEEEHGFHPMKWLCIVLGIVITVIVGANYLLVDQPLVSSLSQTPYANVTVYAHLAAFVQPAAVVIHIPNSPQLTESNLASFLVSLARSTPSNPLTNQPFEVVSLTSRWTSEFALPGSAWADLGKMAQESKEDQETFLMAQMENASGQPLVSHNVRSIEADEKINQEKAWAAFAARFTKS